MAPEIIDTVQDMILANRQVKVRELAGTVSASIERVHFTLHHELHIKKLCARWVPRLLTPDQNHTVCEHGLPRCELTVGPRLGQPC